jgi:hypothetical protein
MNDVNVLAIVVAAVGVVVLSTVYYIAFGKQLEVTRNMTVNGNSPTSAGAILWNV